jgi:cobalt-zinc-cadmium efflux system membrane fusion protein
MNPQLLILLKQMRDQLIGLKNRALQYLKEAYESVQSGQKQLYSQVFNWLAVRSPAFTNTYLQAPAWFKKGLFILPWLIVVLSTLHYFDVFDPKPAVKYVQDPNIVYVNDDLRGMIKDGKVDLGQFTEEVRVSGRIDFNESFLARIGANVTGRVSEILGFPGQMVKQGDLLAKITSTELTQSQLSYLQARSGSQLAEQAANRARILYKEDVIALAELQRREAEATSAKAQFGAANDQLRVQGMDQASIDRLAKTSVIKSVNNVLATIDGEIVERKITKGQVVQPAEALFTVADLDALWAIAEVPESAAYLIRKGQKSSIIVPALRNQTIEGVISHVDSIVNPTTRTVLVRMDVPNQSGQVKPGMLATMLIDSQPRERLLVPLEAIVREDNYDYVYVREDDDRYRMVQVKLGPEGKGFRPVLSGLKEGAEIVIQGAYHLNTERKKQLSGG